jgi:hypothetical protein
MKFAKLFNLNDGGQVVLLKDFDPEEKRFIVILCTDLEDNAAVVAIPFESKAKRDVFFQRYNKSSAGTFRRNVLEQLRKPGLNIQK